MATKKENMQKLIEQRDRLLVEMEALRNKIAGLELAIAVLDSDQKTKSSTQSRKRSTKTIVLDLLRELGTTGLNATTAVDIAHRRGITLDRASVASLLSRLKREEVTVYDGDKYRLKEFAPTREAEPSDDDSSENPSSPEPQVGRLTLLSGKNS